MDPSHHRGRSSDAATSLSSHLSPASPSISASNWLEQADAYSTTSVGQLQFLADKLADVTRQLKKMQGHLRDADRDVEKWRSRANKATENSIDSSVVQEMKTTQDHLESQLRDSKAKATKVELAYEEAQELAMQFEKEKKELHGTEHQA